MSSIGNFQGLKNEQHITEALEEMYQSGFLHMPNSNRFAAKQANFYSRLKEFSQTHQVAQEALDHLNRAQGYIEQGKPLDALASSVKAFETDKNCLEAYAIAGELLCTYKKYDEAIKICNEAHKVFRDYAKVYFPMAKAFYGKGELDKAIRYLDLSIQYVNFYSSSAHELLEAWQEEKTQKTKLVLS